MYSVSTAMIVRVEGPLLFLLIITTASSIAETAKTSINNTTTDLIVSKVLELRESDENWNREGRPKIRKRKGKLGNHERQDLQKSIYFGANITNLKCSSMYECEMEQSWKKSLPFGPSLSHFT